jgi:predicted neutral ceramidase superfamily lipid hydrolase
MKNLSSFRISVLSGLIISYMATIFCHKDLKQMSKSIQSNKDLEGYYQEIKNQRRRNCLIGCIIGLFFSFFVLLFKISWKDKLINAGIILFLTPMVIYNLLPNKKYFLEASLYNIELTNENIVQWFQIYKCMQKSMIIGFIGGFFLTFLLLTAIQRLSSK